MFNDKHLFTSGDLTGTPNQNRPPENDIEVKVILEFTMPDDGMKRDSVEWEIEVARTIKEMSITQIRQATIDYEVE